MIMLAGACCDVETRVEYVDAALYNEGLNLDRMDGMKEKVTIVRPKKSVWVRRQVTAGDIRRRVTSQILTLFTSRASMPAKIMFIHSCMSWKQ